MIHAGLWMQGRSSVVKLSARAAAHERRADAGAISVAEVEGI